MLAKNLVGKQFAGKKFNQVKDAAELASYSEEDKQIPFLVLNEFKGRDLVGIKYEQLLTYALPYRKCRKCF